MPPGYGPLPPVPGPGAAAGAFGPEIGLYSITKRSIGMESYKSYFDCQTVSPELHEKLLAIGRQPRTERRPGQSGGADRSPPPGKSGRLWPPAVSWCWAPVNCCRTTHLSEASLRHRRRRAGPPPVWNHLLEVEARGRQASTAFWWKVRKQREPPRSLPFHILTTRAWTAGRQ